MPIENAWNEFLNYIASQENFPFLRIIRDYRSAETKQKNLWYEFLLDIWFLKHDIEIYENFLSKNKTFSFSEHEEIKKLHDKIVDIFQQYRGWVIQTLLKHDDFIKFAQESAHFASKIRVAEVASEYIYATFMALFMDYEVRRVSQKIFYIQST